MMDDDQDKDDGTPTDRVYVLECVVTISENIEVVEMH